MTIKEKQAKLINEFSELTDWEDKYQLIINYGKKLPEMTEETKTDKYKISGCQSQVWIYAELEGNKIKFHADSDASIVKGLAAMLMFVYSDETPEEILTNPPDFVKTIGISSHLSPTRQNGLGSMMKQIQMYAVAFKALANKK